MATIVVGTWRPKPGESTEDFEIPGPGLYEADFAVPSWILPEYKSAKVFTVNVGEYRVTHEGSQGAGGKLTVRVRIERDAARKMTPEVEMLPALLTVGRVFAALAAGTVGSVLMVQLVKMLTEVRKLAETPAGIGLAALGVVGAVLLLKRGG